MLTGTFTRSSVKAGRLHDGTANDHPWSTCMRPLLIVLAWLSLEHAFAWSAWAADREYEIVVYGATSGGVSAAVQAARMGHSVILIEPGKHLGGMTSGGLGATDIGNKRAIGGISREFYQRVRAHYQDDAN